MTKYQENFIYTTSSIKKLLKIKMVTLLLGHPVRGLSGKYGDTVHTRETPFEFFLFVYVRTI